MSNDAPDILLVDDSANAELFALALKANGSAATIRIVHDGITALNLLLDSKEAPGNISVSLPRLLLLDLHMPGFNGLDVLDHLRADERTQELPVLVFSSSEWESDKSDALRHGANAYVVKPVEFKHICALIAQIERDWLKGSASAPKPAAEEGLQEAVELAIEPAADNAAYTAEDVFAGGGEVGAIMRATDWSKTKLGPVKNWPRSLKTMLGVVLGSRFPMLLWWGPDLLHLYNDAFRPILRDKHPASLAAPAAQVWPEVWDIAGPLARSVQAGGPATWEEDFLFFIKNGDMVEETYFTFSYSPVPGDDGKIGGVLNTVQETTAKVRSERQIRMLRDLAARAVEAKSEEDAYRLTVEVLSANELDLPFVLLYAVNEAGNIAQLVAEGGWRQADGYAKPEQIPIDGAACAASWPFAALLQDAGESIVVDDISSRFGPQLPGRWNARAERAIILPLVRAPNAKPYAFLVAGISPHRTLDDRYREFFQATAEQVSNVIATGRSYGMEKKRAEALAEIDKAKTAFFSNVSHEFRTPLTLILGLVEDAIATGEALQGENLDVVHRNSLRLLRLVNSLLDFTRIEAGRMQLSFVPTDLSKLTIELASGFYSLVESAGMELIVNCPPLPELVYVDRSQWEKIVLNLISNAFKFTFEGEIEVSLTWCDGHAELRVRDTGTGIPEDELPRIFERFHRVENARGRSFEGTGIGLALVHDLVKLHGGSVRITSAEGKGTTFIVTIPGGTAHLPPDQVTDKADMSRQELHGASPYLLEASQWVSRRDDRVGQVPPSAGKSAAPVASESSSASAEAGRILVVDDNADMRDYLGRLLRPYWQVEVVGDGLAAVASATAHPPDLILSDVMMPGLDGFGLVRELRANSQTSTIPVVLLSARAGEESVLEGLDHGADDYLAKPFTTPELMARVRTHLTMARARNKLNEELALANQELEAFNHSVAHDLRAPLRSIDGYASVLLATYGAALDANAHDYLERVMQSTAAMSQMIDDLLMLARVSRAELQRTQVDLSAMALEILEALRLQEPDRRMHIEVMPRLIADGDPGLLHIALTNLLGNAWKYTGQREVAQIEFGAMKEADELTYFVRDNGAGFDMKYAGKLFNAFQRLHTQDAFPGTGIGLATVRRIVRRHGGRIWATATVDGGATFYFTLR
jgi:signal transduction histidine kinase